jgi:type III secretory pathway component EscR
MEDFILNEIDYSKSNVYSCRARRFMKRKLNKELESFFNKRYKQDTNSNSNSEDSDDSELLIKRDKCNFCFGIMTMATMISFYTIFGFIIYRYQSCLVQQL